MSVEFYHSKSSCGKMIPFEVEAEDRVGCSLRKKHDDGTAAFSCGIDFGRDKSETVICESRKVPWAKER